ncbi:MAG TPA: alpha/beta fold hydrolase [Myxococcaceae bacterium]|nr:alpha/beta fold hydrolase [Myxococcaceae bacterium]
MAGPVYSFGPFRLEAHERRLLRDGAVVPLPGKAFDTLLLLVEGAGSLQRQQELIDRLWPDTFVEPNNLQVNVSLVRRVLEGVTGVELQTVRGQGYRLMVDVTRCDGTEVTAPAPPPSAAQRTYVCRAPDGSRLAYARLGDGPPIVKAANWLSHLELDWKGELNRRWLELLSRGRCLVRYDARGNGLSDWSPPSLTFESFVSDLATVFDAAGIVRAPLVGLSQGAAVAAAYAARHPERVSRLILIGGCARGWRVKRHARLTSQVEAMMVLMRTGWGGRNAAFRQMFTSRFFPQASPELAEWWNELQRETTTPENAANLLSALGDVDVRDELPRVRAPALVLHARGDAVVPIKDGLELASGIAGARFVPLESGNHVFVPGEPAWHRFVAEVEAFLAEESFS